MRTVSNVHPNLDPSPCDPDFTTQKPCDQVHETVYDKVGNAIASIEWLGG